MKRFIILMITVFLASNSYGQNYQTVEDIDDACSQLGFMGDAEAQKTVDNILNEIGLFRNFTIQECPEINNAVAKNIEVGNNKKERYILYDKDFFSRISSNAKSDWAATSILAHEIGHHLNGHALNNQGSNHKWELEADEFSGFVLAKMGSSLKEAQAAIATLTYTKATRTHPAKNDRLEAIKVGWEKSKSRGKGVESNEEQALNFLNQGQKAYQNNDYNLANTLFYESKELGNVDANYYLSNLYYSGAGVQIDYEKAFELAKEGYDKGSAPATYQLAKYYANGFGVKKDSLAAARLFAKDFQFKWLKEQYQKTNSAFDAYTIGYIYQQGYAGEKVDLEKAIEWYTIAAKMGDPMALNNLGTLYNTGQFFKKDTRKAIEYFEQSASKDFAIGQYSLGVAYLFNKEGYKDEKKGFEYLKKAALQGNMLAQSQLGNYYNNGSETQRRDYKKSNYWHKKAAEQGWALSQYNIGINTFYGYGVKANKVEGIKWWKKAAEQGYVNALTNLGILYLSGDTFTKDYNKARNYFLEATKKNDAVAQYNMGSIYYSGYGVLNNLDVAFEWYTKSANQGYALAQYMLGEMYYKGSEAVKRNKKKGISLMQEAARQGFSNAQTKLKQLRKKW